VQFKIAVEPGDSGGPLLDVRGRAVGIVSIVSIAARDSRGTGLALPIACAIERIPQLEAERAAISRDSWRAALAQIAEADRRDRESFARAFALPGIAQARLKPGGIEVLVIARGKQAPVFASLSLLVRRATRPLCQVLRRAESFEPLSCRWPTPTSPIPGLQSLRRSGLEANLSLGRVRLPKDCMPKGRLAGIEGVLDQGDPRADRVDLR
jgi:hypothetical protein